MAIGHRGTGSEQAPHDAPAGTAGGHEPPTSAQIDVAAETFRMLSSSTRLLIMWFLDGETGHEVKDIRSGEQVSADPALWTPPAEDLWPTVRTVTAGR